MDGRAVALSVTVFFFLATLEASAQSFYPLRYGKRDSQAGEDRFARGSKYDRTSGMSGENQLFYGSRYGKRSLNVTRQDPKTFAAAVVPDRIGRSPDTETTTRNNRFYFGQRFGKRGERGHHPGRRAYRSQVDGDGDGDGDIILCRYTGFHHLYRCLPQAKSGVGKVF